MLKRGYVSNARRIYAAAAFGRLCVETGLTMRVCRRATAAAFGRLCVETVEIMRDVLSKAQPPSGGCVLKLEN